MDERIYKYFYEELSPEERVSLLRDVEADEELKMQFAEYQNMYALLNLGHQVETERSANISSISLFPGSNVEFA